MKRPIDKDRTKFKLYLEGVLVPFTAARIQETEGAFPNMVVSVPATTTCLKILPGTVVQLSGPYELSRAKIREKGVKVEEFLLFEGEVVSMAYSKSGTGRALQLQCSSLLNRFSSARSYAADSLAPTMHKAANMIFVNAGAPVGFPGNTNETKSGGDDTTSGVKGDPDAVTDFTLNNRFGGIHYTVLQALESIFPTGDMQTLFQRILAHFDVTDYYWHILDLSYRIRGSILAFPNKQKEALAQVTTEALQQVLALIKSGPAERSEIYSLWQIINGVLEQVRFQTITPAAPTGSRLLMGSSEAEMAEPTRMYITPDLDSAPPAMCNVFYPEHIINFSYNRTFFTEPTRSISYLDWNYSKAGAVGQYGVNYMIPDLKVFQQQWKPLDAEGNQGSDELLDYSAAYTPEESYQGARPVFTPIDGWMTSAANKYYNQTERDPQQVSDPDSSGPDWSTAMKHEAMKKWMLNKYGQSRTVTLQTTWNPGRMVGLPGLVIDPGFPTMYGVVQDISTEINAGGSCSSSVTFRSVRAIYDEDPDAFKHESEVDNPAATRVTDNEIFPTVHDFLYDPALYSFRQVGRDVYTYMTQGSAARQYEGDGVLRTMVGPDFWNVSQDQWDSMEEAPNFDQSILNFLRSEGKDANPTALQLPNNDWGNANDDTEEELYSKYLYYAVYRLKAEYKVMVEKSNAQLGQYLVNKTYRNLTPFREYLGYIQASNNGKLSDYKQSTTILSKDADPNLQIICDTAAEFAHKDALVTSDLVKEHKLTFGTGSEISSIVWLQQKIEQLNRAEEELVKLHKLTVEQELAAIEAAADVASIVKKTVYTIQPGDTLSEIAQTFGTSVGVLLSINTIGDAIKDQQGNLIIAGKTIFVPDTASQPRDDSLTEQLEQREAALNAVHQKAIDALTTERNKYEEYISQLEAGANPETLIQQDSIQALYRPYDNTRLAHVLSAFGELTINEGDINISK